MPITVIKLEVLTNINDAGYETNGNCLPYFSLLSNLFQQLLPLLFSVINGYYLVSVESNSVGIVGGPKA